VEKAMNDSTHNDAYVFLLPDKSYQALQEVRNLLFLMSSMIFASTMEEEKIPLQLPRSLLAQCFQVLATQLADAVDSAQKMVPMGHTSQRKH
jgi:hypothetical protein